MNQAQLSNECCALVVSPVLRANRAMLFILGAEVRGALQVDQFVLPHRPNVNVFGNQLLACPHRPMNHLGCRQVLDLKVHGNLPEVLEAFPASPYGAGPRHTMTFTLHHQSLFQYLDIKTWRLTYYLWATSLCVSFCFKTELSVCTVYLSPNFTVV